MELGRALNLSGFGAELFGVASGAGLQPIYNKVLDNVFSGAAPFKDFNTSSIFGEGATVGNLLGPAIGSFFGAKLGSLVISPTTSAGAALASLGSSVGAYVIGSGAAAFSAALGISQVAASVLAPGVGAFVGFVLGALIGKLFGKRKPRIPSASADVDLNLYDGQYILGAVAAQNGGNRQLVTAMAGIAVDTLNGLIAAVVGDAVGTTVSATSSVAQSYGHYGSQMRARFAGGGWQNFGSSDAAVEWGTLQAIRQTRIAGGDLFLKRALATSPSETLSALLGDVQIASDYTIYSLNREVINGMIARDPRSSFAAAWVTTLGRVNELGLNRFQASDFFGGLSGFLNGVDSVTGGTGDVHFEDIDVTWEGGPIRVGVRPGTSADHRTTDVDSVPAQIFRLYDMALGRAPGQDEIREWLRIMETRDLNSAAAYILTDAGVNSRFGPMSDDDFIRAMYQASLHRQPSGDEIAVWRPNVTNNGRGWVLAWFSEYAEHRAFTDPTIAQGLAYREYVGKGLFSVLATASADGRSVQIPNVADIGYRATDPGSMSEGNDFVDWRYGAYTAPHAGGGDDILIGSASGDDIWGDAGRDWLDGGAGEDRIDGGNDDDVLIGGADRDRLVGGDGNDYLAGGDDNDLYDDGRQLGLFGGAGNDTLVGGGGVDSAYGEDGDDTFIIDPDGGGTWDWLVGGAGSDTVSFERLSHGVYLDFWPTAGWSWDPSAKAMYGDGVTGMENITGTQYDDTLYGDSECNVLKGLAGNDIIAGRPGDDVIEGGEGADYINGDDGSDFAIYESSASGVLVDLSTGTALGGDAAGDQLYNIENLRGSRYADELSGDAGNNWIEGRQGDDVIVASGGYDIVDGGGGFDTFDASAATTAVTLQGGYAQVNSGGTSLISVEGYVGSAYGDYLSGGAGDEFFDGGAGNDSLLGGAGSDTYRFGIGYGSDSITESNDGSNSIQIAGGLNFRDIAIWGAGGNGNLQVYSRPTGDQMLVAGNWSYGSDGAHNHKIKSITFEGGSTIDIDALDWTPGGAENDGATTIAGGKNKADLIFALGGDDVIYTAGNYSNYETRSNTVYAGDGNDTIYASGGDDQFLFERGNGVDYLFDTGGADTIVMGPSVAADDVIYEIVVTSGDGYGGSRSDLYIGLRDPSNPNLTASQVADRILIPDGGTIMQDVDSGSSRLNTIEYVRVAGQEIDLLKSGLQFTTSYYSSYSGGGGGYGGGGNIPPIAIDLDGDGIEMRSVEGSHIVTADDDGSLWRTGWLGPDDGFLALDRNKDGTIDRLSEISFIGDKPGAKTDLEGLAAYDSNGDGKLDATDARFGEFKVWRDKNQDGFGSASELMTLSQAGIVSIGLKGQATGFTYADGVDNTILATTDIVWSDAARQGRGYDVALATRQVRTDGGDRKLLGALSGIAGLDVGLDSKLFGIQTLNGTQLDAAKAKAIERKAAGAAIGANGGLLGRVESVVAAGVVGADGLLRVTDPTRLQQLLRGTIGGLTGLVDRYANSAWTKAGLQGLGDLNTGIATEPFVDRVLTATEKLGLDKAKQYFEEHERLEAAKAAARATKDAVDAVLKPVPFMPTPEEMERLTSEDGFMLPEEAAQMAADQDAARSVSPWGDALESSMATRNDATPASAHEEEQTDQVTALDFDQDSAGSGEEATSTTRLPSNDANIGEEGEESGYTVVIQSANARLVQALASFGEAPAMMASYQGVNAANDPQAAWLSVDALPSVRHLAAFA